MPRYTLVLLDTSGIQPYLFSTNNLQQNAGASYLADRATRAWVQETLPCPHNVLNLDTDIAFRPETMEDGLQAEVLYAGGGNTAILFQSPALARDFTRRLTARLLLEAPGLNVFVLHKEFDWEQEALGSNSGVMAQAFDLLTEKKQRSGTSHPVLGLGVTSRCVFTDLPAVGYDNDQRPLSAESWAKFANENQNGPSADGAYERLVKLFFANHPSYRPARDFDDFGRSREESSYLAIVHTDGNGMGERIISIREAYPKPAQNRAFIEEMRAFSTSIYKAAQAAMQSTIDRVAACVEWKTKSKNRFVYTIADVIELPKSRTSDHYLLPIRPIVFGGDDVTFVCDGRLGLSLAAHYVQAFSGQKLTDGRPAYCRAGVAIIHTHSPFTQGYRLAEKLCASAKKSIQEWKTLSGRDGLSAIDWHYAIGGVMMDLSDVRRREYTSVPGSDSGNEGDLLMRPLLIDPLPGEWRTWPVFLNLVGAFQSGPDWKDRRNKVKALRDALRQGPEAVETFRAIYRLGTLPAIDGQRTMPLQGWQGNRCGYFDAIEAMDLFINLAAANQQPEERR